MTMREARLEQLKNLKGKPFRERWAYIKEYFGMQILAVLAVMVLLVSIGVKIATEKATALSVACINAAPNYEQAQDLIQQYGDFAGIDLAKSEVKFSTDLICTIGDPQENYQSMQKLASQLTAGALDALVSDRDTIVSYMYQEVFWDLTQVLTNEQQAAYGDKFLYADLAVLEQIQQSSEELPHVPDPTKPEQMERPVPMALRISADAAFADRYFYYYNEDVFIGLVLNSQNLDNALAFLDYLYETGN